MESMDQLSMEQLVESSFHEVKEGEVVRGTVVAITNDEVMVDVGFKSEGVMSLSECTDRETGELNVEIGQEIEVYVARIDEMEGVVRLSRERAAKLKTWTSIEQAWKNGEMVKGRVLERVKGGLAVDIGVRAFLPGSLVDLRLNRRLEDYIGEEIEAQIISFDRRRSNVVLSRKAILEEAQKEAKEATMAELEEGKLVTGTVKNITDYGVFIDLGGLDGLLHITDISWGRVGHPSEYFKVGDEVDVVVLRFDRERERVSLGYKQRFEDPWVLVPEKYPLGKRVQGKVVSIVEYGAFVELEEGVEGLIHVSEMSWTKKIKNPRSVLEVGDEVEVVVSEVDPEKRRLSLSLRATEPNPWEEVAEKYHVGSKIRGTVRNLTDFGAFVEIVPGVDGLVHISDMSWTRRINHPSEVVQKGQEVDAVISAIDVVNQRISLSMKDLLPNEWEEYANTHGVGDIVSGKVTNVTDFGVFIELSPGVEGLCHVSEIDRGSGLELNEMFSTDQAVRCRILRIDWNENRIGLSMHGVEQEGAEDELVAATEAASGETAMAAALKASGLMADEAQETGEASGAGAGETELPQDAAAAEEPAEEAAAQEPVEQEPVNEEAAAGETAAEEAEVAEAAEPEAVPEEPEAAGAPDEAPETVETADAEIPAEDGAGTEGEADAAGAGAPTADDAPKADA
ncbi:MAG: 30S ribosomal protein S1 [Acidobacteria bacterium]|nr:30S ribosomal protein S1 [Acidobacteriota bacterium]